MSNSTANPPNGRQTVQGSEPTLKPHLEANGLGERGFGSLAKLHVSPEAIRALPSEFVRQHRVLPFQVQKGTLHVATSNPGNQRVIEDIRLLSGLEVEEFVAPGTEILEKIAECYQVTVEQMIENLNPEQGATGEGR